MSWPLTPEGHSDTKRGTRGEQGPVALPPPVDTAGSATVLDAAPSHVLLCGRPSHCSLRSVALTPAFSPRVLTRLPGPRPLPARYRRTLAAAARLCLAPGHQWRPTMGTEQTSKNKKLTKEREWHGQAAVAALERLNIPLSAESLIPFEVMEGRGGWHRGG